MVLRGDGTDRDFMRGENMGDMDMVIALTGDDETNLQIVMTCSLLRPDVPVVARASTRRTSQSMADFKPTAIINPFDDYGEFLLLALEKPHSFRLLTWLSSDVEMELPPLPAPLSTRTWLIVADGQFGHEIASDLAQAGQKVIQAFPGEEFDLDAISGVVAGAESDTTNLALAAHIRSRKPDIYLAVRQQSHVHLPLLDAFKPDSIFFPPRLVVQRVLTNLISPRLWGFFETVMEESDEWAARATERIVARVGTETPRTDVITISAQQTPSVHRWLGHRRLELGTLFRSPLNAAEPIAGLPLLLIRGGKVTEFPADTIFLRPGDEIVMLGSPEAFDEQTEVLYDDSTLYYAATGHDIPTSQAWRRLTGQRWKDAFYG
jgi:Trk K+ transport system NAD-binding subunit